MSDILITVDSSQVPKATQELKKAAAQALETLKASKKLTGEDRLAQHFASIDREISKVNATMAQANKRFSESQKGAKRFQLGVQQAGYQIGDFAVQVASGTNPLVAFSQQATQLVGFFGGPWGAAIGAGIAIVSGLVLAYQGMIEASRQAKQEAANLKDILSTLNDVTDQLNLSVDEMIDRYGVATGTVREFAIAQAESALAQAEQRLGDQLLILDETTKKYTEATNAVNDFGEAIDYSTVLRTIREDFKGIGNDAMALYDAFVAIDTAANFEEQKTALLEVDRLLKESGIHARDLPPELNRALFELRGLVEEADRLASAMNKVKSAASNMTFGRLDALSGLTGSELLPPATVPDDKKSTRVSGSKKRDPLKDLQEQLKLERELVGTTEAYQRVRRALGEEFAKTSPKVVDGLIAQINETEKLIEVEKRREQIVKTISSSLENGFMSMIDGTLSVKDAFKKMAYDIIKELYRVLVVQRLVGSFNMTTRQGTGIVGGLAGLLGFRESGGTMMAGNPYIVGERGPELVIPRHSGTVVNANQTSGALGGGSSVTVQNNISVTGSDAAMVRAEVAKMIPQITNATKAAVIDAKQRGGQMAAVFR